MTQLEAGGGSVEAGLTRVMEAVLAMEWRGLASFGVTLCRDRHGPISWDDPELQVVALHNPEKGLGMPIYFLHCGLDEASELVLLTAEDESNGGGEFTVKWGQLEVEVTLTETGRVRSIAGECGGVSLGGVALYVAPSGVYRNADQVPKGCVPLGVVILAPELTAYTWTGRSADRVYQEERQANMFQWYAFGGGA